jgi:uncharacterized membrane protein
MNLSRFLKHFFVPDWVARRAFPAASLSRIERAIRASEQKHDGELRFVIEAGLPFRYLLRKRSSRRRAEDLFASLKVWDTERNSGVLIYVQLVSRHIDIVADRGISRHLEQAEWNKVCKAMEKAFRAGRYEEGALEAIETCTALLARHFPPGGEPRNELPDRPVFL